MGAEAERAEGAHVPSPSAGRRALKTHLLSVLEKVDKVPYKSLVLEASYSPFPALPLCHMCPGPLP